MKTKLIYSNYDQETGKSVVTIRNKFGTFTGEAFLHPDERYASSFQGCKYAEIRAMIKCVNYELALLREQIHALAVLERDLKQMNSYNYDSLEMRSIRKRFYEKLEEEKSLKSYKKSLQNTLSKSMTDRDKYIKKVMKNKG